MQIQSNCAWCIVAVLILTFEWGVWAFMVLAQYSKVAMDTCIMTCIWTVKLPLYYSHKTCEGNDLWPKHTWCLDGHQDKVVGRFENSILNFGSLPSLFGYIATNPASLAARAMWDGANVSGQVASHTNVWPFFQGTTDNWSGLFPSE